MSGLLATDTYVHFSLPLRSFRLLRFTPNTTPDDIQYELASFPLSEPPPYNALSYCWGNADTLTSIQCNGKRMMITPLLKEAMKYLRVLDRGGVEWIWIDQICINQADTVERGVQVDIMKDIYKSSQGTIIWLGQGVPGIEASQPLIDRLSHLYEQDINPNGTRRRSQYTTHEYVAAGFPSVDDPAWTALEDILSRPWFVRSWVIQETVLPRTPPRIICGGSELSWEKLVSAASWVLSMCYRLTPLSLNPTTMPALISLKLFSELRHVDLPWELTSLLNKATRFKASEPRDRVYSLLAMTVEAKDTSMISPMLRANYKKQVEHVFRDVTRHIIVSTGSLSILTLMRHIPNWNHYPSWVVDFTADAQWERISYFVWATHKMGWNYMREIHNNASGGRELVVQDSLSSDILALEGLQIDTVDTTCEVMSRTELDLHSPLIWLAWRTACQLVKERYQTTEAIARAFMVTLTADWSLNDHERMRDQLLTHFWSYMSRAYHRLRDDTSLGGDVSTEDDHTEHLITPDSDSTSDGNPFALHLDAAHNRRLFFTKNLAYIGLGPGMMQKDDILCILFGGATPMVLRPDGDHYRFIGECYVFDLMDGEAVRDWNDGKHTMKTFPIF